jgi:hypothetical protein
MERRMEPEQLVAEELRQGSLGSLKLSADLQNALDRHCANLATLVTSLENSGRDREAIRSLVGMMLRSYEDDLLHILEKSE